MHRGVEQNTCQSQSEAEKSLFFVVLCSAIEDKMSTSEKPDTIAASKLCILALTMGFVVMAKVITSFSSKCADLSCNTPVLVFFGVENDSNCSFPRWLCENSC